MSGTRLQEFFFPDICAFASIWWKFFSTDKVNQCHSDDKMLIKFKVFFFKYDSKESEMGSEPREDEYS